MSYVVCCNTTNDEDLTTGNRQPNSFTNNFKSPLIVEPNSEVAVESVKINRSAQFDSKLRGRRFFLYWGPEQNDEVGVPGVPLVLNRDVTKTGVEINPRIVGSFSIRGYATELQKAINQAPLSPNIFGNNEVTIQLDPVTNEWKGFSYTYEQRIKPPDNKGQLNLFQDGNAGTVKNRYDIDPAGATDPVDFIGQNFHANVDNTVTGVDVSTDTGSNVFCRVTDMVPLSPIGGECEFELKDLGAEWDNSWTVGITRPATAYLNGGQPPQMPRTTPAGNCYYPGGINETYMDYMVHYDAIQDLLFVREYTKTKETNGTFWNRRDITYWGAGKNFVNQAKKADLQMTNLTVIQFKLVGNEVKILLHNPAGMGPPHILTDSTAPAHTTARAENCRPTTNSTEWLVPACALWANAQDITLTKWEGIDFTDATTVKGDYLPVFPSVTNPQRNNANLPAPNPRNYVAGGDWGSYNANDNPRIIIHNDTRYSQVGPTLAGPDPFIFSNLVAAGDAELYNIVMVAGQENYTPEIPEADQALYVIPQPYHHANMSRELGFGGDLSIIKQSIFAAVVAPAPPLGQRIEFLSLNAGAFSIHSAFVRVNDLTLRSFNGATQSRSQILWHLPKFSNEGKQFGDLYFSPGEKTYIKLHNTHRETINQLSLDIVGRNEQVVQDLTGATIVVLHIRRCHTDLEENSHC